MSNLTATSPCPALANQSADFRDFVGASAPMEADLRQERKLNTRKRVAHVFFTSTLGFFVMNAASAAPCDDPQHRAFDFWMGEWQVRTPDGKLAGVNRIEREYGGCILHERYDTGRGYRGESLNIYDAGRRVWHQTWVDTSGTLLVLEGGIKEGKMVLEGQTVAAGDQVTKHRITWTPNQDGSVRQLWESTDVKGKWITAFDGQYTRK